MPRSFGTALPALLAAGLVLGGCGGGASHASSHSATSAVTQTVAGSTSTAPAPRPRPRPRPPGPPVVLRAAAGAQSTGFIPAVRWRGQTAVWIARTPAGVALLRFNPRLTELHLHSGTVDAGGAGWRWGPAVLEPERRALIAAFNGGFKFITGAGGFLSYGRVGYPLRTGLGSIVTYADGTTGIGTWRSEVPAAGADVISVRQNLGLLVDHGAAADVGCLTCWGATLHGVSDPARSGLGVTADGSLVWAGGEHLTPSGLASALLGAGVVRAVELDINPEWVAGYLYRRFPPGALTPVPVVPGQPGVPGYFLAPYGRDFFAVAER